MKQEKRHSYWLAEIGKGRSLNDVPPDVVSKEMCLAAIRKWAWTYGDVPEKFKADGDVCMEAVAGGGNILRLIPEEAKSRKICMAAVRGCGLALKWVPERERNAKLCEIAVRQDGLAVEYVPSGVLDERLCLMAIRNAPAAFGLVPEAMRTRKACMAAVKRWGGALRLVPESLVDRQLCMAAVSHKDPCGNEALAFVPKRFCDMNLLLAAVRADGAAVVHAAKFVRGRALIALCDAAVAADGMALRHVPPILRDVEMCTAAVRQDPNAREFVPEDIDICKKKRQA